MATTTLMEISCRGSINVELRFSSYLATTCFYYFIRASRFCVIMNSFEVDIKNSSEMTKSNTVSLEFAIFIYQQLLTTLLLLTEIAMLKPLAYKMLENHYT